MPQGGLISRETARSLGALLQGNDPDRADLGGPDGHYPVRDDFYVAITAGTIPKATLSTDLTLGSGTGLIFRRKAAPGFVMELYGRDEAIHNLSLTADIPNGTPVPVHRDFQSGIWIISALWGQQGTGGGGGDICAQIESLPAFNPSEDTLSGAYVPAKLANGDCVKVLLTNSCS